MITKFATIMACVSMLSSRNPVKLSSLLLILTALLLMTLASISGSTWFPLSFYLLFMGGIIMMFMILSSLTPNEKASKLKFKIMALIIFAAPIAVGNTSQEINLESNMSNLINTSNTLMTMAIIMSCYFLGFIYIIGEEKFPMRAL